MWSVMQPCYLHTFSNYSWSRFTLLFNRGWQAYNDFKLQALYEETQPFYFTMNWRLGGGGQSIFLSGVMLLQIIKPGRFLCLYSLTLRFTSKLSGKDTHHKAGIQIKVPWLSKPLSICDFGGFLGSKRATEGFKLQERFSRRRLYTAPTKKGQSWDVVRQVSNY